MGPVNGILTESMLPGLHKKVIFIVIVIVIDISLGLWGDNNVHI